MIRKHSNHTHHTQNMDCGISEPSLHLFRNQKLAVQAIIEKFKGENWVHPGCPVPVILQGPTGCGKSLTACQTAVELGVETLIVIGPCAARQAWEETFRNVQSRYGRNLTCVNMTFCSSGLLTKRYIMRDTVTRQTLGYVTDIDARIINTHYNYVGSMYRSIDNQRMFQFCYLNITNPDLTTDDLFMKLPWHDKRNLKSNDSLLSNDSSTGTNNKRIRTETRDTGNNWVPAVRAPMTFVKTKNDNTKGNWMLVVDESHVSCGSYQGNTKHMILSTICATLREEKAYLLLISATPISTTAGRNIHIGFLGYGQYYNDVLNRYHTINSTISKLIVPKFDIQLCEPNNNNAVDICWNHISQHHCVLQGDAPKTTILEIEARFYEVLNPLFTDLKNCTAAMRQIINMRTFTDQYGKDVVCLDKKNYKNVAALLAKLEALKIPLFARLIIETIESEYCNVNSDNFEPVDSDYKLDNETTERNETWICPKTVLYVNSTNTADAVYRIVNDHFIEKTKSKKRKLNSKEQVITRTSEITGILAKSSIPDRRRITIINNFNEKKEIRYFIGTYAAYAASINLQDKIGKHPRYTFLAPTTRFTSLDQAAGRCWRPQAMSDSYVRMVFVEGLEEELVSIDQLCRRKAIQDKYDLGKLLRPPLPGEYTMRLDRTGEIIEFTALKFGINDATAQLRQAEYLQRKNAICLVRNIWALYYDNNCGLNNDPNNNSNSSSSRFLLHSISEEMMELVMSYVIY